MGGAGKPLAPGVFPTPRSDWALLWIEVEETICTTLIFDPGDQTWGQEHALQVNYTLNPFMTDFEVLTPNAPTILGTPCIYLSNL